MTPENVSTYSYNNSFMKDVLTHYTSTNGNIDSDVLFDEVGNITYFNGQTYTWNANRQLETVLTADNDLIRYYYNENGFLSRLDMYDDNGTVCSGSLSYIWNGDVLVSRYVTDYESDEITYSNIIYDTEGDAVGTVISQTTDGVTNELFLLYRKNLQGDITGLIDSVSGKLVAAYTYDAYGNPKAQAINDNNLSLFGSAFMYMFLPQSYRGYTFSVVGEELCYYLGSRFYSPRLGRFLNADKHFDTGTGVLGTNVFAYCNNNPVMYTDPTGEARNSIWSLKSDWAGREILYHYLTGNGKNFIRSNGKWGAYMRSNTLLTRKIQAIISPYAKKIKLGKKIHLNITTHIEIQNGEDIIGYQYLHGTNSNVGDFKITGTIICLKRDTATIDLICTWNDLIDPNFKYSSDQIKARFGWVISLGRARDYRIKISWNYSYTQKISIW